MALTGENDTLRRGHRYEGVEISGSGQVFMGDSYTSNTITDAFSSRNKARAALFNALTYQNVDSRRTQLGQETIGPSSFEWVWNTAIVPWLRQSRDLFWISGKPGAGKSTLMRYLTDANQTLHLLENDGNKWQIIHFFFDFRSGNKIANQTEGMIRSFLIQLAQKIPQAMSKLLHIQNESTLDNLEVNRLIDIVCEVLRELSTNICAFIDGLDEHDGDNFALLQTLENLNSRTDLKLCLASRSVHPFDQILAICPKILMHEHNQASMQLYMQNALLQARPACMDIEKRLDSDLRKKVINRAQGVVLWMKLATDELVGAAIQGKTSDQLHNILDTIPTELQDIYQRILENINPGNRQEAATLLYLFLEFGGIIELAYLPAMIQLLSKSVPLFRSYTQLDEKDCLDRLTLLLNPLLDVRKTPDRSERELFRPSNMLSLWDRTHNQIAFHSKAPSVATNTDRLRLMHYSLYIFLLHSPWTQKNCCPQFRRLYVYHTKFKLYLDLLRDIPPDNASMAFCVKSLDDNIDQQCIVKADLDKIKFNCITSRDSGIALLKGCLHELPSTILHLKSAKPRRDYLYEMTSPLFQSKQSLLCYREFEFEIPPPPLTWQLRKLRHRVALQIFLDAFEVDECRDIVIAMTQYKWTAFVMHRLKLQPLQSQESKQVLLKLAVAWRNDDLAFYDVVIGKLISDGARLEGSHVCLSLQMFEKDEDSGIGEPLPLSWLRNNKIAWEHHNCLSSNNGRPLLHDFTLLRRSAVVKTQVLNKLQRHFTIILQQDRSADFPNSTQSPVLDIFTHPSILFLTQDLLLLPKFICLIESQIEELKEDQVLQLMKTIQKKARLLRLSRLIHFLDLRVTKSNSEKQADYYCRAVNLAELGDIEAILKRNDGREIIWSNIDKARYRAILEDRRSNPPHPTLSYRFFFLAVILASAVRIFCGRASRQQLEIGSIFRNLRIGWAWLYLYWLFIKRLPPKTALRMLSKF